MERRISVVGLGGSMAPTSSTVAALKLALAGAEGAGAETRLFEISALDLPMFVPGAEAPDSARRLTDAVHEADALLWSSPVYHGTISGSFKNALDWLELLSDRDPPYLANKLVGLIGTAPACHQHPGGRRQHPGRVDRAVAGAQPSGRPGLRRAPACPGTGDRSRCSAAQGGGALRLRPAEGVRRHP